MAELGHERTVLTPIRIGGTTAARNRLYRAPVLEGAGDGEDAAEIYAKQFVANAGLGGLFAMEAWHEPYASQRQRPLLAASKPPLALRPVFRRAPIHVMTADDIRAMATQYGEVAAWAREAGYDGLQLASSNAKLLDQFLSPFYNRRTDEFGGSPEGRARILRVIRDEIGRRAGWDYTCTVKIPVGEKAPPFTPKTSWDEGVRMAEWAQEWGYDAVTPVHVSVLPDTTLSRGGTRP